MGSSQSQVAIASRRGEGGPPHSKGGLGLNLIFLQWDASVGPICRQGEPARVDRANEREWPGIASSI